MQTIFDYNQPQGITPSIIGSLKKEITLLQAKNQSLQLKYNNLEKSLNATNIDELNQQIQAYQEECQKLKAIIQKTRTQKKDSISNDITSCESPIYKQINELKFALKEVKSKEDSIETAKKIGFLEASIQRADDYNAKLINEQAKYKEELCKLNAQLLVLSYLELNK